MKILSVEVCGVRNLKKQKIEFSPLLNVVRGKNAQGKTNLVEAIYFCAVSKSFRTSKEKELVFCDKNGRADGLKIKLNVQKKYTTQTIEIIINSQGKKIVKVGGIAIKRIADLFGQFNCVFFSPDELKLVKEAPADRRKFMDIDISQVSKHYFFLLLRYEKILASRNKLLKQNSSSLKEQIDIYTQQLCDVGSKIILSRINFLSKLSPYCSMAHSYLTNSAESLEISYSGITGTSSKEIAQKMKQQLDENYEKDLALGFTSIGPHRDDIKILLDKKDVRVFASQGQQRTVALSLKLAELEIIKDECGEMPVLVLDDVLSELDHERQKKLVNFTQKAQTILTCNHFDLPNSNCQFFDVEDGVISKK